MRPILPRVLAASVAIAATLSILLAPARSYACWDGYAASVGPVVIMHPSGVGQWSPDEARSVARWGTRLAALLPSDAHLHLMGSSAICEGAGCGSVEELELDPELGFEDAFERVTIGFGVSRAERASAFDAEASVFTVQIFAGSLAGAAANAARRELEALGLRGFVRELPPGDAVGEQVFSLQG